MTAYITPRDGIARRFALISLDRDDAMTEAILLGRALFGALQFTFCVVPR